MILNIVYEETNGLHHDANVLAKVHMADGGIAHLNAADGVAFDAVIFLEHIDRKVLARCERCYYVPNLEWMTVSDAALARTDAIKGILCKTRDTYERLSKEYQKCVHIGMTSIPVPVPVQVPDLARCEFFHLKGSSMYKNSQVLVDTWLAHPEWPTLHVVCRGVIDVDEPMHVRNVTFYQKNMGRDSLNSLMTSCRVHMCPSLCEGFGHYINEARSCKRLIVTTNAPPMNELVDASSGVMIEPCEDCRVGVFGTGYTITRGGIETAVRRILAMDCDTMSSIQERAYARFVEDDGRLEKNLRSYKWANM